MIRSLAACAMFMATAASQPFHPEIPKAWDERELTSFELPLAQADRSPRYPSAEIYYSIPILSIYRSYPVYTPDKEPQGYWKSLQEKDPEIIFDASKLKTKQDWIQAGQAVFEAPITFTASSGRDAIFASLNAVPGRTTNDGVIQEYRYVVRKKGVVELGLIGCSSCHTRALPDGTSTPGPPTAEPLSQRAAWRLEQQDPTGRAARTNRLQQSLFATPWVATPDGAQPLDPTEFVRRLFAMQPGVVHRVGASPRHPVKIPSLIGIADLKYFDATGLGKHRSVADLMRYAIINQGFSQVAHYGDFQPRALRTSGPNAETRYSDEQLYALALYLYSLKPPPNPNPFNESARRGQRIFNQQGCTGCHPAPLYTNNKLTPVSGFKVPDALRKTEQIMDISVGTDPGLALETRRGTGFYKVPSLRGVWMRDAFNHEGSAASLEEWFDPARLADNYVPKGFHLATRPIRGHEFGLALPVEDRAALIAFLKAL